MEALPLRRPLVVLLLVAALVAAGALTAARPAKAEPRSYYMYCFASGQRFTITQLTQCRSGYVRIYSTYDGSRVAQIDVYAIVHGLKPRSLSADWKKCQANFWCNLIAGSVATWAFGKFKVLWTWLRNRALAAPAARLAPAVRLA
jgi:hypothetical protein